MCLRACYGESGTNLRGTDRQAARKLACNFTARREGTQCGAAPYEHTAAATAGITRRAVLSVVLGVGVFCTDLGATGTKRGRVLYQDLKPGQLITYHHKLQTTRTFVMDATLVP
eukprot:562332-Rhodomonas_salina.1